MTNNFIELNKEEIVSVSGGMSDFAKRIEDTLCSSSIYGAITTAVSVACPHVLSAEVCAGVDAVMLGVAFIAVPIFGEVTKNIATKNETVSTQPKNLSNKP